MKTISIAVTVLLLTFTAQRTVSAMSISFENNMNRAVVPVELCDNILLIRASVNGSVPGWFIFDTGAGYTLLDSTFAVKNGIDINGHVISKSSGKQVRASNNIVIKVGGAVLSGADARIADAFALSSVIGRKIDGILGYDLLSQFVVEVNYINKQITFFHPDNFTYSGNGKMQKLQVKNNWPYVNVKAIQQNKHIEGPIILDIGGLLAISMNNSALAGQTIEFPFSFGINGAGGASLRGRLDSLTIAGIPVPFPITGFPAGDSDASDHLSTLISENGLGTVGGELMKKFTFTFNYRDSLVFIEPNRLLPEITELDMSGLMAMTVDSAFRSFMIIAVIPMSPAHEIGLQPSDELLSIDGNPASGYTLSEIRSLFKVPDRKYMLEVKRGNEILYRILITRQLI